MKSLVFNGNCQLHALADAPAFSDVSSSFFLSFRAEEQEGPALSRIKEDLLRFVSKDELASLIRFGGIGISVPTRHLLEKKADVVVLNLFHKRALYTHNTLNYCIACKIKDLRRNYPALAAYIEAEFTEKYQTNDRYFDELHAYIGMLRKELPSTKMLLLKRFDPGLYDGLSRQWVTDWDALSVDAPAFYERCEADFDIQFVDTNEVMSDALKAGYTYDDLFPYLVPRIDIDDGKVSIRFERDLEHGTPLFWGLCGQAVATQLGLRCDTIEERQYPVNSYEVLRQARGALMESVAGGNAEPMVDFIRQVACESESVDLTAFLAAAALLFQDKRLIKALDRLRSDFRFSLTDIFDYLDMLTGAVDLNRCPVVFWGIDDYTSRIIDRLSLVGKKNVAVVDDSGVGEFHCGVIRLRSDDLTSLAGEQGIVVVASGADFQQGRCANDALSSARVVKSVSLMYLVAVKFGEVDFLT